MKNILGRSCTFGAALLAAGVLAQPGTPVIEAESAPSSSWQVEIPEPSGVAAWNLTGFSELDSQKTGDGKPLSPQSYRNYRAVLQVLFRYAVAKGYAPTTWLKAQRS
jgi:hypothetical protein